MKRLQEDANNPLAGGGRRRLVQMGDLEPAAALRVPVVGSEEPAAGSALMQQLQDVGVSALPQLKPGGRRKRAVQARVDLDAASLLLGAVSTFQGGPTQPSAAAPVAAAQAVSVPLPVAAARAPVRFS